MIIKSEDQVVYDYNHEPLKHEEKNIDPIKVFNINNEFIGYSWKFKDLVTLTFDLNESILHVEESELEDLLQKLKGKKVKLILTDIRGNEVYSFEKLIEELKISFVLNNTEENLIKRNTYKLNLILESGEEENLTLYLNDLLIYVK